MSFSSTPEISFEAESARGVRLKLKRIFWPGSSILPAIFNVFLFDAILETPVVHERIVGVNHKRAMYYVQSEINHRQVLLEFALTSLAINRYKNKYTKQAMRLLNRTTIML